MDTVVYTADVGSHDDEWDHVGQTTNCRWVRFTEPVANMGDRLSGRWYKTHPHILFPDADLTIWIDACLQITSPSFVADVAAQTTSCGVFRHPDRDNVTDELKAADTLAKYDGARHRTMLGYLDSRATPEGLHALTVIARRGDQAVLDLLVWFETVAWSTPVTVLDQLIFPYAIAMTGGHVQWFDRDLWANDWFIRHPHRRET